MTATHTLIEAGMIVATLLAIVATVNAVRLAWSCWVDG